jgi:hypothetical protein
LKALCNTLFVRSTYPLRRKTGFLTSAERYRDIEVEAEVEKFLAEGDQAKIKKIRKGEVRPLFLETSATNIFPVSGWKIFIVDDTLDKTRANELLQRLDALESDEKGKFKEIMVAIGISGSATHEARQLLRDAGAKIVDEEDAAKAGSESNIDHRE